MFEAECVLRAGCRLGESPTWHPQSGTLYWADILGGTLHRLDPVSGDHTVVLSGRLVSAIAAERDGSLLLLGDLGRVCRFRGGALRPLRRASLSWLGFRFNDCIADSRGRVLAGMMGYQRDLSSWKALEGMRRRLQRRGVWPTPTRRMGALCRLDPDGRAAVVLGDLKRPNGLAFSPDERTLYVTDSGRRRILACDYDPHTGHVGAPWVLADAGCERGVPDGLVTDEAGCLWSVHNGAGEILRYDPTGHVIARATLPVTGATSLCFGGTGGADLYVTSAGGNGRDPTKAGGIFRLRTGVRGNPVAPADLQAAPSRSG